MEGGIPDKQTIKTWVSQSATNMIRFNVNYDEYLKNSKNNPQLATRALSTFGFVFICNIR